jgi:hypothetical protein
VEIGARLPFTWGNSESKTVPDLNFLALQIPTPFFKTQKFKRASSLIILARAP